MPLGDILYYFPRPIYLITELNPFFAAIDLLVERPKLPEMWHGDVEKHSRNMDLLDCQIFLWNFLSYLHFPGLQAGKA
jgi:hypothetical protein